NDGVSSVKRGGGGEVHGRGDALARGLARFGAESEWLADGSVVATLTRAVSATDQAVQAARCALAVRECWPSANVALATGRGVVRHRMPMGEAIDRAADLLRAARAPLPE